MEAVILDSEQSIINQARRLYIKLHIFQASLTDTDKEQLNGSISTFINIAIKETPAKQLVHNSFLLSILKTSIKLLALDSDDIMPIARAFASLERYFLLLVEQPWKPEFKKIKMYGGFYRTRIKSVVPDCEQIFQRAGYILSRDNTVMTYQGKMEQIPLLLLAFDCKIGFIQCQIIGEHYNKIKGINMSLMDAVYNILRDEPHAIPNLSRSEWGRLYSSNTPQNFVSENFMDVTTGFKNLDIGPPAIPKREPIPNGSNTMSPRIRHEAEMLLDEDAIYALPVTRPGFQGMQKSPNKSYSAALGKSPLVSGVVIDENFVEIIPELPQRTSDEHIMESLRVLEQQKTLHTNPSALIGHNSFSSQPKVEQWLGHEGKYTQASVGQLAKFPNTISSVPIYQGHQRSRLGSTTPSESFDEGIDISYRFYQANPASARYPSLNQVPGTANRSCANYNPSLIDQGYKTGPSSDPMFHYTPTSALTPQTIIYHAPSIGQDDTTVIGYLNTHMRQATGPPTPGAPPPVPSRALKPNLSFRAQQKDSTIHDGSSSQAKSQSGVIMSRSLNGSGGLNSQSSSTEPILRHDKLGVSKSSSLRYSDDKDSAYQQAIYSRPARSMDISLLQWECKACTAWNKASDMVCSMCSHSRHGPEASHPECGKTKKACAKCTYENEPSRTACEVCEGVLQDRSTYV